MGGSPSFSREPLSPEKVVIVTGGNTGRNLGEGYGEVFWGGGSSHVTFTEPSIY